ncbi:DUF4145 domain-containing protein [Salmonella enterica]|nr:DUF4145 domain-containing protein [Salmonella enterica]
MAVHKISGAFFKDMQVEWPCPECGQKTLQIIPESLVVNDTHDTNKQSSEIWFEPEMHVSIFSCMARCSRRQCGEVVACQGDSGWRLGLKERLKKMPPLYEPFSGHLTAIKFLGDAGSHTYDKVNIRDIEDAFEIMEYVVNDLFSGRKESVEVLTKRLNDKFEE